MAEITEPILLELSSWGAGNRGFSYVHFYVYTDGRFEKEEGSKLEPAGVIDGVDGKIVVSKHNSTVYTGKLGDEKFNVLKEFLNENVKENSSSQMFDAGYKVIFHTGGREVVIENNMGMYNQITKLVPYDVKMQG